MNVHTVDIGGEQYPIEDTEARQGVSDNANLISQLQAGLSGAQVNIAQLFDRVDKLGFKQAAGSGNANGYINVTLPSGLNLVSVDRHGYDGAMALFFVALFANNGFGYTQIGGSSSAVASMSRNSDGTVRVNSNSATRVWVNYLPVGGYY